MKKLSFGLIATQVFFALLLVAVAVTQPPTPAPAQTTAAESAAQLVPASVVPVLTPREDSLRRELDAATRALQQSAQQALKQAQQAAKLAERTTRRRTVIIRPAPAAVRVPAARPRVVADTCPPVATFEPSGPVAQAEAVPQKKKRGLWQGIRRFFRGRRN